MWVSDELKTDEEIYASVYEQAFHIQKLGTKLFPPPNKLEFEAVKRIFLLIGKKTYAAIQWSSKPKGWLLPPEPKANIKGMATKKRDKCQYAHKIGETLIKRLLENNNDSIEEYAKWYTEELEKIPKGVLTTIEELNPFVITCALNSEYKKDTGVSALSLATMIAQETGARPRPGTRLAFVSAHFRDDRLHADACVIPDVFLRRKDRIDIAYYLEKQIWNCVKQILCLPIHEALRDRLDTITKRYVHTWKNKRAGNTELTSFFQKVPSAKKSKSAEMNLDHEI
jgi:DNA polymerase elongation subunit (family B)